MATSFTIVNPYVGHGIAVVSGEDAKAVDSVVQSLVKALTPITAPHSAPANLGFTNGPADGEVVRDQRGVTVTLFRTTTEAEGAAIRGMA
jgi:hypothetical protein